jgi:type I restriction enzyme S subunit
VAETTGSTRVAFGDVVRLSKERTSDPDADGFGRYVGLEHLDPGDLRIRRWGDVADGTTFTNVFRPGQVLFGKRRAYQRKIAVAEFEGVCSGDIYVLESKDASVLLPELVPFICQTDAFFEHAVGTSAGSLSPRTNWTSLAGFELTLPDIAMQRRLAAALGATRACKAGFDELAARADALRGAVIETDLRRSHWGTQPLGDVAEVSSGGTPSRSVPQYWNGDIPWVKTGEIDYGLITATEESITHAGLENSSARLVRSGAVLMAMYGQGPTLGRVARLAIDAATNQACAIVEPSDDLDGSYLYFYLWHRYATIRMMARGASQPNLTLGLVKSIEVPMPPLEVQRSLMSQVEAALGARDAAYGRAEAVQRLQDALVSRNLGGVAA